MPDIRMLAPDEWPILRHVRLSALRESPQNFLSTYEREEVFSEVAWRAEFSRGDWYVSVVDGQPPDEPVSLVGITREPDMPTHQCFLEYLWVMPKFRRCGIAFEMVTLVLDHLKRSGIQTVFLWIVEGNDPALLLYERLGFITTNERQKVDSDRDGRCWERLRRDLI